MPTCCFFFSATIDSLPMVASKPHLMACAADLFLPCLCMPLLSRFQSCPIFCDPLDHSLPGSSVCGIFSTRILKWVAMPTPRYLLDPEIKPTCSASLALQNGLFTSKSWESPSLAYLKENTLAMPFSTLHYKCFLYSGSFLTAYKYTTISLNIKKYLFLDPTHLSRHYSIYLLFFKRQHVSLKRFIFLLSQFF